MRTSLFITLCALFQYSTAVGRKYSLKAEEDRVPHLPGFGALDDFGMFAGYISVSEKRQRKLFYILVESEEDPVNAPLMLWLNGGPGCSSVGGGFLTEMGPWYPNREGLMINNPHSWNKFANVLYVEAPAFVGFSYSREKQDRDVGDKGTAEDNLSFLIGFFDRFPELQGNSFWLSGESYAGHFVPQLAREVIIHNACVKKHDGFQLSVEEEVLLRSLDCYSRPKLHEGRSYDQLSKSSGSNNHGDEEPDSSGTSHPPGAPLINLVGLTIGNAWTDARLDNTGTVDHWWTHSMISDHTFDGIRSYCDLTKSNPLDPHPDHKHPESDTELCDYFCNLADDEIGPVDIYDMIADDCREPRARGEVMTLGRRLAKAGAWAGLGVKIAAKKGTQAWVDKVLTTRRVETQAKMSAQSNISDARGDALSILANARSKEYNMKSAINEQSHKSRTSFHRALRAQGAHVDEVIGARYRSGESGERDGVAAAIVEDQEPASPGPPYDPCVEDYGEVYLNRADVQVALHANQSDDAVPWRWVFCNHDNPLRYQEEDLQLSMLPIYDEILSLKQGLRILLYSGDADASVPALGTRYWLAELGLRQTGPVDWRTWTSQTKQVGGYVSTYKELQFATVRAAGHMVPYSQPERASFLISHFVFDKELPK